MAFLTSVQTNNLGLYLPYSFPLSSSLTSPKSSNPHHTHSISIAIPTFVFSAWISPMNIRHISKCFLDISVCVANIHFKVILPKLSLWCYFKPLFQLLRAKKKINVFLDSSLSLPTSMIKNSCVCFCCAFRIYPEFYHLSSPLLLPWSKQSSPLFPFVLFPTQ